MLQAADFRIYLSEHFFRFHNAILATMIASKSTAKFVEPMECLPVSKLPAGKEWTWEIKLDGWRMEAVKNAGKDSILTPGKGLQRAVRLNRPCTRSSDTAAKAMLAYPASGQLESLTTILPMFPAPEWRRSRSAAGAESRPSTKVSRLTNLPDERAGPASARRAGISLK
jgi:hypothetical protein